MQERTFFHYLWNLLIKFVIFFWGGYTHCFLFSIFLRCSTFLCNFNFCFAHISRDLRILQCNILLSNCFHFLSSIRDIYPPDSRFPTQQPIFVFCVAKLWSRLPTFLLHLSTLSFFFFFSFFYLLCKITLI